MKIYFSPSSPFVRKCMVVAHELGLESHIEKLPAAAGPVARDRNIVSSNPLGQVPTLFTDEGQVLYDSRVVCEYLNELGGGDLIPREGSSRWLVLTEQSLADGMLDAALLSRYEKALRPAELRWNEWVGGQMDKIKCGLDHFESGMAGARAQAIDIGTLTLACALGYLDFRFADYGWREGRPVLTDWFKEMSERPSIKATVPA